MLNTSKSGLRILSAPFIFLSHFLPYLLNVLPSEIPSPCSEAGGGGRCLLFLPWVSYASHCHQNICAHFWRNGPNSLQMCGCLGNPFSQMQKVKQWILLGYGFYDNMGLGVPSSVYSNSSCKEKCWQTKEKKNCQGKNVKTLPVFWLIFIFQSRHHQILIKQNSGLLGGSFLGSSACQDHFPLGRKT